MCGNLTIPNYEKYFHCFLFVNKVKLRHSPGRPSRSDFVQPEFVIDAQVFPGSSGSPVYINYTFEDIKNGRIVLSNQHNIKVLGSVAQTMVRNNILQTVPTGTTNYTQEVLGLGIVFKSTVVKETIDLALKRFEEVR